MPDDIPKIRTPELDKPGPRKPLTRAQILTLAIRQIGKDAIMRCGCGCGEPLDVVCIDEHLTARELLPADRCDDLSNRALFNRQCSKAKTVNDQAIIGHWRRVRQDSGQAKRRKENGPQIKGRSEIRSRGFPKDKTRGFDGKIRERVK